MQGGSKMAQVANVVNAALAVLMLASTPGVQAKEGKNRPANLAREIVLDDKTARGAIVIRTARDFLTTVEFPEDVLGTNCPGCTDWKGADGDGLFRVEPVAKGRYLAITPTSGEGRRARAGEEPLANMLVRLEHATLVLHLERVEKKSVADTRVVLLYPNRSPESEYVRTEKAKLEAESAATIQTQVTERFLHAFAEPHHCARKGTRARNDDIVLEVREMCYFGREVILSFTIENRGRVPIEVGSIAVNKGARESKRGHLPEPTIEFQKVSSGVMSMLLPEGENTAGPYELTVSENTGKHRVVTVGGLEF
jgi:hypothetical protein